MGKRVYDWAAVQQYHDQGHNFVECCRHFGFSHTAWVKAMRRGDLVARPRDGAQRRTSRNPIFGDRRRIYDWGEVQRYYDEGNRYSQCQAKFGFCSASWYKACQRGELTPRPLGMPIERLLEHGRSRRTVKIRLLKEGLLKNVCAICGLTEWCGAAITLHIDHINGVKGDHRLENLRMLCPNCHSQTETYSGRNIKKRRRLQGPGTVV